MLEVPVMASEEVFSNETELETKYWINIFCLFVYMISLSSPPVLEGENYFFWKLLKTSTTCLYLFQVLLENYFFWKQVENYFLSWWYEISFFFE